jgi:signal transduction histidine kinase
MMRRAATDRIGRAAHLGWLAGVAAWAAILLQAAVAVWQREEPGLPEAALLGAVLLFGALFTVLAGPWEPLGTRRAPLLWIGATVACAVAAPLLAPEIGLLPVLFVLSAAVASEVLAPLATAALIVAQTVIAALAATLAGADGLAIATQAAAIAGFQVFAAAITLAFMTERQVRRRLAEANAELHATRALLAEGSQLAERARIARELHDLVGHHLTALSLHLEVATHLADDRTRDHVERSRAIAKLLIADVRSVVTDLRRPIAVDVAAVLGQLVVDLPRPRVHLDVAPGTIIEDLDVAHVVVRCVQEAITNAIRHGDADNVWVSVRVGDGAVDVRARDDGRGAAVLAVGNGLRGMRERLDGVGGGLEVTTAPGAGFSLHARVPRAPLARPA